jgi:hypothetical protein
MYNFANCLQFKIRYEKVERPAPVGGALVFLYVSTYITKQMSNSNVRSYYDRYIYIYMYMFVSDLRQVGDFLHQ